MTTNDAQKPLDTTEADSPAGVSCAAASGSEEWTKGYAQGHQEGYERGMAAALPLPTDIIAVRVPCPLPFMLAIMKAFGRKYPKGRMRQVGEWTHFTNEEVPQNDKLTDAGTKTL